MHQKRPGDAHATAAPNRADAAPASPARLLAVCTGRVQRLRMAGGRSVPSAFCKTPVAGPVAVSALGLQGDQQADRLLHGGPQKAVYAYPAEHLDYWRAARAEAGASLFGDEGPLPPGFAGENLSVRGLLETAVWIGDTLCFEGSAVVLRVTAPREPCGKFTAVAGLPDAARRMVAGARCGFYLAVEVPGTLAAGMAVRLVPGARRVTVAEAIRLRPAPQRRGR